MKISSRARYGTGVMLELALNYGNGPLRVRDIAKRQGLSAKYAEQLIALLKGAGMVNSARGVHGGYSLAKQPSRLKMLEIFELLEGSLEQLECRGCATKEVWAKVRAAIEGVLESMTLTDMAAQVKEKERQASSIYYI